jgi:hypothetical protein
LGHEFIEAEIDRERRQVTKLVKELINLALVVTFPEAATILAEAASVAFQLKTGETRLIDQID